MKTSQLDNSTLKYKVPLRKNLLAELGKTPVILETHGGYGRVWERVYRNVVDGIVFEKDSKKAEFLAQQRPTWAVYECDSAMALADGVGMHIPINFIDLDPYGEPWPVLDAALSGLGPHLPDRWALAVNDGLRNKIKISAWDVKSMRRPVEQWGESAIYREYLHVCKWLIEEKISQLGFKLAKWAGYYCGHNGDMTHYGAILERA